MTDWRKCHRHNLVTDGHGCPICRDEVARMFDAIAAQGIEAAPAAKTATEIGGLVHESPVAESDAPNSSGNDPTTLAGIVDAVTDKVLSYRPVDKGLAAKKTKRQLARKAKRDD